MPATARAERAPAPPRKPNANDDWCTPGEVVDTVLAFAARTRRDGIALDPCSHPDSLVAAKVSWCGPDRGDLDGLVMPWPTRGLVYMNPPYSAKLAWMRKASSEALARGVEIIALLPADTDTTWFQEYGLTAPRLCFWRGRLRFHGSVPGTARFPSVLFYWPPRMDSGTAKDQDRRHEHCDRFAAVFGARGWIP
jgi:hypothetical protein